MLHTIAHMITCIAPNELDPPEFGGILLRNAGTGQNGMDYHGVYCTLVIWPVAGAQARLFPNETPQNRYARSVEDKLKIVYILGWCNVAGVANIASHRGPRWLDHLARMPDERLSEKMLLGWLVSARQVPSARGGFKHELC